jgi:hypothetical protein
MDGGVAGPYWSGAELPDFASGTFSELVPFSEATQEEHVDLIKRALNKTGLAVRTGF